MKKKKAVFIIDDEVDFTDSVKFLLEHTGLFEVGICNEGTEAIARIRDWKPDLILLDIMMPGMDGTEIAQQLRADKQLCTIPVMFLTSLLMPSEAASHPLIANYPFLPKPINGETLIQRLREFFQIED